HVPRRPQFGHHLVEPLWRVFPLCSETQVKQSHLHPEKRLLGDEKLTFSPSPACTLSSSWDVLKLTKKQTAMELTDNMKQTIVGSATRQRKIIDLGALRSSSAWFSPLRLLVGSIMQIHVWNSRGRGFALLRI
ncbi:hypothetical protein ANANG_G00073060, partial [Anguilla anguilla]